MWSVLMRKRASFQRTVSLSVLFLTIACFCLGVNGNPSLINIFWNTTNPMFRIDNNDNVFDINMGNHPFQYDQANIICPTYPLGTPHLSMERYIIYMVSREEYENCHIGNPHPRVIAVCNKPHDIMYVTITFRSFTPTPGGLEFKPGHDYFFISTSTQHDLHRRFGGRCSTNNMKIMFKVAQNKLPPPPPSSSSSSKPDQRVISPYYGQERTTILGRDSDIHHDNSDGDTLLFSDIDSNSLEGHHISERRHSEDEKLKYFAKTAIKQEASVMKSASSVVFSTPPLQVLMSILVISFARAVL